MAARGRAFSACRDMSVWRQPGDDEWRDDPVDADLKTRSVRGGLITAVVQVARVILMLLSQVLLARLLDPADFGLVAMVAPVIGFVQVIADLGITQALVSAPGLRIRQINAFFWLNVSIAIALAVVAAASAPLIAWLYGEPRLVPVVLACSGLILVSGVGLVQAALLNRQMRFGAIAAIDVTALLASVAAGVAAAAAGWGYWALIVAQAAFGVATTGLVMACASWRPYRPGWDGGALGLIRFGGAVTAANLVNYVNVSVDNVIIGSQLGKIPLGLYDRAWKLAVQPITQIQSPFNRVAIPILSRLAGDADAYRNAFLKMLQILLAFSMPVMICAAVTAVPLVELALGERWVAIAPLFAWMTLSGIVAPINAAAFWLLITQGRVREQVRLSMMVAAINVSAYLIGVRFGLVGLAAVSVASVYLLQVPLLIGSAIRRGPVRLRHLAPLLAANACAGLATGASLLLLRVWTGDTPLLLLASPPLAMLVASATLLCFPASRRHLTAGLRLAVAALRRGRPEHPTVSDAI